MLNYYILQMKSWLEHTVPVVINEKNFLWIMGSLFLLGIVTKWSVARSYGKLIRKAEDMKNTKSALLRQIKNKYEGIKQVGGNVPNSTLFVQKYLNKNRIMHISANKMNNIINWCAFGMIVCAGFIGAELYFTGGEKVTAMFYIVMGGFFAFALEIINRNINISDKRLELTYTIVDYLDHNNPVRQSEPKEAPQEQILEDESHAEIERQQQNIKEEQILNQVIGEFLQ